MHGPGWGERYGLLGGEDGNVCWSFETGWGMRDARCGCDGGRAMVMGWREGNDSSESGVR